MCNLQMDMEVRVGLAEVWEPPGATQVGMVTTTREVDMDRTIPHPGDREEEAMGQR